MDPFDLIDQFGRCRTTQDVGKVLAAGIASLGFQTYAIGALPTASDPNPGRFVVHNWPESWTETYFSLGFGLHDPVPKAVMVNAMPFTIGALRDGRAGVVITPEAAEVLRAAEAIGRGAGLVVPITGPHGYHAIAVICGSGPDPQGRVRAILHLWAIYAHDRLLSLHGHVEASRTGLTAREIAVMREMRNGASDQEIATALGISVRTVRFHVNNLRRRLGANSRAEALILAENRRLLGA
jgi:DNA-binding CsgD family transcriptional regulator